MSMFITFDGEYKKNISVCVCVCASSELKIILNTQSHVIKMMKILTQK